MQNFIITLLICSVAMSGLALVYMTATPFLAKRYSEKWRYYAWLIIIVGLIIPFRPQHDFALFRVEVPSNVPPVIQTNGEAPSNFFPSITLPNFDLPPVGNTTNYDVVAYETPLSTGLNISFSVWQIAAAIWLTGVIAFIVFQGIKHYRFVKTARRWCESVKDEHILSLLESLKSEMGITRHISLHLCECVGSPMMVGLIKPRILLPSTELEHDELCFILKHELVHYKRKDLLYKYLVLAAMALHWFNPVVYLISRAINILCETSCDTEVVKSMDADMRLSYSETIIGVVKYQSRLKTALSTNFYGGKKGMKNRISSIMDTRKKRAGAIIACLVLAFTMSTGLVFAATANSTEVYGNTNINIAIADNTAEVDRNLETSLNLAVAGNTTEVDRNSNASVNVAIADNTTNIASVDNSLFNAEAVITLEQLGLTFYGVIPLEDGRVAMSPWQIIYYYEQLVRLFADVGGGTWITSYIQYGQNGLVDVHVLRDNNGNITGLNVVPATNEPLTITR